MPRWKPRRPKRPKSERIQRRKEAMRRGIFLIPSIFTTLGLFFGFMSIIRSFEGRYQEAALSIMVAAIFDFLDGYIARLTRASSEFGVQYDSLADLVAFGLAPGILAYTWALHPFGRIGWLATFLYFACATLRLARYNVQSQDIEKNYFQGLPTTAAGMLLAAWVVFHYYLTEKFQIDPEMKHLSVVIVVYGLAFLMVSNFRYVNLKKLGIGERHPFQYLVIGVLVFIVIASKPFLFLFPMASLYAALGPLGFIVFYKRRKREKLKAQSASEEFSHGFNKNL